MGLAQTDHEIATAPAWQLKSYAKKALARGDLYAAIDYYERYCQKRPDNLKVRNDLADLYRQSRDYRSARATYQDIVQASPEKHALARFHLAQMHMQLADYDSAKVHFNKFLKAYKGGRDYRTYKKRVKAHLVGCDKAPSLLDSILKV